MECSRKNEKKGEREIRREEEVYIYIYIVKCTIYTYIYSTNELRDMYEL